MCSQPLISVLVPAYNAAGHIERALHSALCQDHQNVEVVIVDDGSEDETCEVVRAIDDSRVHLVSLAENSGECAAMNAGLTRCTADYVAFLDADDEWLPTKLSRQIERMLENEHCSFVMCENVNRYPDGRESVPDATVVDSNAFPARGLANMVVTDPGILVDGRYAWKTLLCRSYVAKPSVLARKACLLEVGGFDESLRVGGDQDMWIRLALLGEVACIEEPLTIVHKTEGSLMSTRPLAAYEVALPLILRHLRDQRAHLTRQEVRTILGANFRRAGIALSEHGHAWRGRWMFVRSAVCGHALGENLRSLLAYSLPRTVLDVFRRFTSDAPRPGKARRRD